MKSLTYIDAALSDRILDFLKRDHAGRDKAIPYQEVMAIFGIPSDLKGDHGFRKLYENRVGSCSGGNPKGIYYIRTYAEYLTWHGHLERTYGKSMADKKGKVFLAGRPDLKAPAMGTQPSLWDEAGA
jgi:hypothetical protein